MVISTETRGIKLPHRNAPAEPQRQVACNSRGPLVELARRAGNKENVAPRTDNQTDALRLTNNNCKAIAKGGFGQVFRASGTPYNNGNPVAIKVLHRNDAKAVVEMDREAATGQKLGQSDNIVKIFGRTRVVPPGHEAAFGPVEALVMEHIDGPTLTELQTRAKYLYDHNIISHEAYWSATQFLLRGVAKGLSDMAEKNFVHTDMKGDNAIYDRHSGTVKLIDLGGAVKTDQTNHICYTPVFASPEQWKSMNLGHPLRPEENRTIDSFPVGQMAYFAGEGHQRYFGIRPDKGHRNFKAQVMNEIQRRDVSRSHWHQPSIPIDRNAQNMNGQVLPAGTHGADTAYTSFVNNATAYSARYRPPPQDLAKAKFLSDPMLSDDKVKDVIERIMTFANAEVRPLVKPNRDRPKAAEPVLFEQMVPRRKKLELAAVANAAANSARARTARIAAAEQARAAIPRKAVAEHGPAREMRNAAPLRRDTPQAPPRLKRETVV
ncbi:protein kinase domain-containing protein [Martelella alba]|uniref:protein kinase domain-containing protein n=1 Tax=Martelella alba TaxID=2590451 RepID=UPI0015E86736|nr:protein kinase [Martelella alba]